MKKIIEQIRDNFKLGIILIGVGLFFGWLFFHSSGTDKMTVTHEQSEHDHSDEQNTIWTCSMHPQIKQDKPGKCPICAMDLVPLSDLSTLRLSRRQKIFPEIFL
jgi:Cu(I)/Ag(I) efflux system membrane fusion protein